ncbi:MAG: hypothetical protein GX072_07305, partial [Lysinibacillus sp.]|nr:hypothetical protein [Lysinibacillus sp.]
MNQSGSVIELQLNRPNLFQFATSELSQDAFLCWLMSWAQKDFQSIDETMQKIAVNFISEIFNLHK